MQLHMSKHISKKTKGQAFQHAFHAYCIVDRVPDSCTFDRIRWKKRTFYYNSNFTINKSEYMPLIPLKTASKVYFLTRPVFETNTYRNYCWWIRNPENSPVDMVNLPLFSRVLYIPSGDPNLPRILRFASMKLGGECWHFQRGGKPKYLKRENVSRNQWLGGGFKHCLFSSLFGEMIQFDYMIFFRWVETTN